MNDNFDFFQLIFINKIPKNIMRIIRKYCIHKYIIIFNHKNFGIQYCFISGINIRDSIKNFIILSATEYMTALSLLMKISNINHSLINRDAVDRFIGDICISKNIMNPQAFIRCYFDILVDTIYKYNDGTDFKIVRLD